MVHKTESLPQSAARLPPAEARARQDARDLLLEVSDERVLEVAEAAGLAVSLDPREVGELGVDADAEDLEEMGGARGSAGGVSGCG